MNIEDLFPLVRRQAKGCPNVTLRDALRRAARELCFESWYVTRTLTIDAVEGTNAYALQPVAGSEEACAVKAAQFGEEPLLPVLAESVPDSGAAGSPTMFYLRLPATIVVLPVPDEDAAGALRVRVAVQPKADALLIPDELGNFDRALASGALAWLHAMPGEQWTDVGAAERLKREFFHAKSEARRKAQAGHLPRSQRVLPRRFAV